VTHEPTTLLTTDRDFIPLAPVSFFLEWVNPAHGKPVGP
jgi:hypothetical protein